ncbi:MAG TPA: glycosyltransferase family 1 protein [Candidatus Eisenbacteria bacterium]|nr:glycosyltransferase family 1 protein [Candidatus Eisenbacteria bacterium]
MILGIEAANVRSGGGITYLKELLAAHDPAVHGFSRIVVWSGKYVLDQLPDAPWLDKRSHPFLDRNVVFRLLWQRFLAASAIQRAGIDVLFVPGGLHDLRFRPLVTMSHNMLPFEPKESRRYGLRYDRLRLWLLGRKQKKVFAGADGVIFLTRYARDVITRQLPRPPKSHAVVPHGITEAFRQPGKPAEPITAYSDERPFQILYVSIIDLYKHQRKLVHAVLRLRRDGMPVRLRLVGPDYAPERADLDRLLRAVDARGAAVDVVGPVPHRALPDVYRQADLFAFPSSCENLPNILLEAMASTLPIACSDRGPMPEVLEDGGVYLDPEDIESMRRALKDLIERPAERDRLAARAAEISRKYSWRACADSTFGYLASFARRS